MSKGQTSSDSDGWKRGEKGFSRADDNSKFLNSDYKKELLKPTKGDRAVGQRATVRDSERQRDY